MTIDDKIVIYQTDDGKTAIEVKVESDTLWLSQGQMAELFLTDRTSILRHIKNIYKAQELSAETTCAYFAQVRHEGQRQITRQIPFYNLDMIISVGYRVNSRRGTQFRIWANKILREYMVKGYAVNTQLSEEKYSELSRLVNLLARTVRQPALSLHDSTSLVALVADYNYALETLDRYDYQRLTIAHTSNKELFRLSYDNALRTINALKEKLGEDHWFANEKDMSFHSSIGQIYQTFDGKELYPSVEEKAAMLLYLVTKNHSFTDGNKRIAAMLFLWYLHNNGILYAADGTKHITDSTLVALTLMIAESRVEEKDMIIKVVVNLINRHN